MPAFCPSCGKPLAEGAGFCGVCGAATSPSVPPPAPQYAVPQPSDLQDNVAGMLAYVTIIPAIIFLVIEPYKNKRFVRFHAFQCLFLAAVAVVLQMVLRVFEFVPLLHWSILVLAPVGLLVSLGIFAVWLVAMLKAYQGQYWKIPIIGELAEKQADV